MENVKWGFIGCGKVVQQKSGKAFNEVPHSCIHAIMRRNICAAKQSAHIFNASHWYDSVDDILKSDVDAIYIATPPGLHYEQAISCCIARKPVYIEKPFARNYTEAKAINDAFFKNNVPLFIGHYRRALPRFIYLKKLIDGKTIGDVSSIQFSLNRIFSSREAKETWLYNPELSGGGKFFDIAAHSLDIIAFLFGDIVEIHGFATNSGTQCPLEDSVVCSFLTSNGIPGTAIYNCISNKKEDRLFVNGTKGAIDFSVHGNTDIGITDYRTNIRKNITIPDPEIIEQPMIQLAVAAILYDAKFPCTGTDALPTYWAIDQVLEQFYNGRQRKFWEE